MFILSTFADIIWFYILVAIIPAIALMIYIYRQDKIEKEPPALLVSLAFKGVAAALISIILEEIFQAIAPHFLTANSQMSTVITAFLGVACIEEGSKYFFLYRSTWDNPDFNYKFDAIVYAAFVSLGFAAFENIGYVFNFGITVAPTRAFLAIPGHLGFSVFMGYFYGRARKMADYGHQVRKKLCLVMAYLSAVFLHGFYDSCAMLNTQESNIIFFAFVAIMYVIVILLIRHESKTDTWV
jgi:RsiW-degrading membrane proteinase PrsW (M82 family)